MTREQIDAELAGYRHALATAGYDWGVEIVGGVTPMLQFADRCDEQRWMAAFSRWKTHGVLDDPFGTLIAALRDPLPTGVVVAAADGLRVGSPLPYLLAGHDYRYEVIAPDRIASATVSAGAPELEVNGHRVLGGDPVPAGRLRLEAGGPARWSIVDDRGGAWYPRCATRRYDAAGHPFFHGDRLEVDVPAVPLAIRVARGTEWTPADTKVTVAMGESRTVALTPTRLYDAAARGWYGADLHVHLNYTGDTVLDPAEATLMQRGEGLHVLNLVAANYNTARVYDRAALDTYAGQDLPGSEPDAITRFGVEYRNDLYGHAHAFGADRWPQRLSTGHPRSGDPNDAPANAIALAEMRAHGATIGYTHAVAVADTRAVFDVARARSYEAREVVVDAPLGLVDSLDLLTGDVVGTEELYHRLLGCGLRLAATAGTDVMLSRSRGRLTSNPVGWCRAYADLRGAPLSAAAWQDAVRAGRTFATNGPWLEISVAGHGPGDRVDGAVSLLVVARAVGRGLERVEILGPEGALAVAEVDHDRCGAEVTTVVTATAPTWLAAAVRGGLHPLAAGGRPVVYAHTSPVWVDIDDQRVARPADAGWCLSWLDRLTGLIQGEGRFEAPRRRHEVLKLIDQARAFYGGIAGSGEPGPR